MVGCRESAKVVSNMSFRSSAWATPACSRLLRRPWHLPASEPVWDAAAAAPWADCTGFEGDDGLGALAGGFHELGSVFDAFDVERDTGGAFVFVQVCESGRRNRGPPGFQMEIILSKPTRRV